MPRERERNGPRKHRVQQRNALLLHHAKEQRHGTASQSIGVPNRTLVEPKAEQHTESLHSQYVSKQRIAVAHSGQSGGL